MIEEELGCSLKEAFAEITEMPMAAASLGQVSQVLRSIASSLESGDGDGFYSLALVLDVCVALWDFTCRVWGGS